MTAVHYLPVHREWHVILEAVGDKRAEAYAATEPQARTAAAIRARAMEASDAE